MTSWKRAGQVITGAAMVALGAAHGAGPAAAQQGGDVETAPLPAPRGLDFRLPPADDGRDSNVQGPSDNGLPPAPRAPTLTTPPRSDVPQSPPRPAPILTVPKAVVTQTPKAAAPNAAPAPRSSSVRPAPSVAEPETGPVAPPAAEIPDAAEIPAPILPEAGPGDALPAAESPVDEAPVAPSRAEAGGTPWWAWALAGLAALLAGVFYWRRQGAGDRTDEPALLPVPEQPAPAARAPPRAAMPKAAVTKQSPLKQQPLKQPLTPPAAAKAPVPVPPPAPPRPATSDAYVTAAPLVRRPVDEVRADVAMEVAVRSIRIEADHVAVGFLLTLSNRGRMDATGLMVRIALGQGSAMNEMVLGRFYDGAGGSVLRDDIDLAAGRSEQLSSEVKLPRASIEPLMMAGKPMMVPVLAADVTYNWDGPGDAFGQIAAAYVLGRAPVGGSDKLAPIPLDHVPLAVDRPGARATAVSRRQ